VGQLPGIDPSRERLTIPAGRDYAQPVEIKSRTIRRAQRSQRRDPLPAIRCRCRRSQRREPPSMSRKNGPGPLGMRLKRLDFSLKNRDPRATARASTNAGMSHVSDKYSSGISNRG